MSDEPLEDVYGDFGMAVEVQPAAQDPSLWGQAATAAAGIASLDAAQLDAEQGPPLVKVDDAYMADATLYADLYDEEGGPRETLLKTQVAELQDRVQQQEQELLQLRGQVEELQQQNEELEQQRSTLATNISSLYKTAKLELQRKDAEIKELRDRVAPLPGRSAASLRGPGSSVQPAGSRPQQGQQTTGAAQYDGQREPQEQQQQQGQARGGRPHQQQQLQQQRESRDEQRVQSRTREPDGAPMRNAGGNSGVESRMGRGSGDQKPGQPGSHQPLGGRDDWRGREAERQPTGGGARTQSRGRDGSGEKERGRSQGWQREEREGGGSSRQRAEQSRASEHGRSSVKDRSDRPRSRDESGDREARRGGREPERRRGGSRDRDDRGGDKRDSYHDTGRGSREREGRRGSSRDRTTGNKAR